MTQAKLNPNSLRKSQRSCPQWLLLLISSESRHSCGLDRAFSQIFCVDCQNFSSKFTELTEKSENVRGELGSIRQ